MKNFMAKLTIRSKFIKMSLWNEISLQNCHKNNKYVSNIRFKIMINKNKKINCYSGYNKRVISDMLASRLIEKYSTHKIFKLILFSILKLFN